MLSLTVAESMLSPLPAIVLAGPVPGETLLSLLLRACDSITVAVSSGNPKAVAMILAHRTHELLLKDAMARCTLELVKRRGSAHLSVQHPVSVFQVLDRIHVKMLPALASPSGTSGADRPAEAKSPYQALDACKAFFAWLHTIPRPKKRSARHEAGQAGSQSSQSAASTVSAHAEGDDWMWPSFPVFVGVFDPAFIASTAANDIESGSTPHLNISGLARMVHLAVDAVSTYHRALSSPAAAVTDGGAQASQAPQTTSTQKGGSHAAESERGSSSTSGPAESSALVEASADRALSLALPELAFGLPASIGSCLARSPQPHLWQRERIQAFTRGCQHRAQLLTGRTSTSGDTGDGNDPEPPPFYESLGPTPLVIDRDPDALRDLLAGSGYRFEDEAAGNSAASAGITAGSSAVDPSQADELRRGRENAAFVSLLARLGAALLPVAVGPAA